MQGAATQAGFDDSSWAEGLSGFGKVKNGWARVNTPWQTSDLWLRRTFDMQDTSFANPDLRIFYDDSAEVYLNGEQVAVLPGNVSAHYFLPLREAGARALRPGRNALAVHVHQDGGASISTPAS